MNWLVVIAIATVLAIVVVSGCRAKGAESERVANRRLVSRLKAGTDYSVFIGIPVEKPTRWVEASSYNAEVITTEVGEVSTASVTRFVVAYKNGQVLDAVQGSLALPPGLEALDEGPRDSALALDFDAAREGLTLLSISFAPSVAKPHSPNDFATEIRNVSDEAIRVTGFGAFVEVDGVLKIDTVTGKLFSSEEFVEWYGVPDDGWIQPGTTVVDRDNYGDPGAVWAYYGETRSGQPLVSGKLLPHGWHRP